MINFTVGPVQSSERVRAIGSEQVLRNNRNELFYIEMQRAILFLYSRGGNVDAWL